PANADWQAESNQATAYFGYSVASAGDVNNDGYDEVIVGAYYYDNVESNEGAVFVFSEPPTPSAFSPASGTTINNTTPTITFSLNKNGDCKCSLTDQAYGEMETDCSGDGTKNISCPVPDLGLDGAKTVYISCKDTMNSADNSETNEHLSYTLDTTPPSVSLYSPANDTTDVSLTTDLELTFDEAVNVDAGNIVIYKSSDDSVIETIDVTSDQVSGSGTAVITINPTTDFSYETKYYIQIDPGALVDAINNSYSGITEATTWTFTTEDVPICPVVAHALTYDAYPTCNPTSCKPGYVLSAGVCKLSSGGSFSILSLGRDDSDEHISTSSTEHIAQIKTQGTDMQLNYQFSRDLKLGTSNEEVRELQKYLNAHGFTVATSGPGSPNHETTYFGPATRAALSRFQEANNITPALGYFGPLTRAKMFLASASSTQLATGTLPTATSTIATSQLFLNSLSFGQTHSDVLLLQQLLNTDPATRLAQTGVGSPNHETSYFGSLTLAAVKRFQIKYDIAQAGDRGFGHVGPKTRAELNKLGVR
ncbi:MAG TPA: Ig-like domain-containing protein, partial [Candidatus Paceibacterota bacterium]|nr:Ig-like domain-containing protein [Candidatus Paceibacterota bacterium]